MFQTSINIDLLWKRIYEYTNYANLDRKDKMYVDKCYEDIFNNLIHTFKSNEYRCKNSNVFDYESTKIEDLRHNFGNWLIDNKLDLVFSNQFGSHKSLRCVLLQLHLFVEYDIKDCLFLSSHDEDLVSDFYTGLHLGVFLSGLGQRDNEVDEQPISIGSRYFLLNKEINQDRLTRHFDLDVTPYELHEAKKDINNLIKERYNGEYYIGRGEMPKRYQIKK